MAPKWISTVVGLYREYAKIPALSKGYIDLRKPGDSFAVQAVWQVRDLERAEMAKFSRHYNAVVNQDGQIDAQAVGLPVEQTSELLSSISSSGEFRALVRKIVNEKGEEKQYLEVWNRTTKLKTVDIQALDVHGKIYTDDQFGCLEWAADEAHLLYVAEAKQSKAVSFFKRPKCPSPVDDELDPGAKSGSEDDEKPGEEYLYKEEWGEALVGKVHPVLCIMDVDSTFVSVLSNLPDDVSAGQAIWAPDDQGVVCVGWKEEPRKLGLTYCTNRKSLIYYIDFESASCSVIGDTYKSVRSPRFSPDFSQLVFLQNEAGGPHHSCSQLMKCDWATKEVSIVVDVVFQEAEDGFPGIFVDNLPRSCWASDNRHVIFHTAWHSMTEIVSVDTTTGKVSRLTSDEQIGSWGVLDVKRDLVLVSRSSLNLAPQLVVGSLSYQSSDEISVIWYPLEKADSPDLNCKWEVLKFKPVEDNDNPDYAGLEYEAILVSPSEQLGTRQPLIVWPHGGPHSVFTAGYQLYAALFSKLGFYVLMVNYRGSTGFGENSIRSLLGNIGNQDVKDVQQAVEAVVEREDLTIASDQIVLFGGSHGGFLVTHLSGQYPDFYRTCICRNPVVDVSGMEEGTDIPDWCYVEAGLGDRFSFEGVDSPETLALMWEKSPISHIEKVRIPTLFLLGRKDLRVPASQGFKYFHSLKARGIPVRLHVYDDNHALSKVEVESDAFVNIAWWLFKQLKIK